MKPILLLIGLLASTPVQAQPLLHVFEKPAVFKATMVVYAGAAVWDARRTVECHRLSLCTEVGWPAGPIAAKHGIKKAMAGKLAAQTGYALALVYWRKKQPYAAGLTLAGFTAAQIAVDAWNEGQVAKARRRQE